MSKVELKDILSAADRCDFNFYNSLTTEQKKTVGLPVIARFMSLVTDSSGLSEYYIQAVQKYTNMYFWEMYKHPDLQWKMIAASGSGMTTRHIWVKENNRQKKSKLEDLFYSYYPLLKEYEISILIKKHSYEEMQDFLESTGMDNKEVKSFLKEFKELYER